MKLSSALNHRWSRQAVFIVAVSLLLGISGPFGTYEVFNLGQRMVFWLVVLSINWVQWVILVRLLTYLTRGNPWPPGATGTVASFPFAALISVELTFARQMMPEQSGLPMAETFLWILALILGTCWLSQLVYHFVPARAIESSSEEENDRSPIFLKRIPHNIAGDLLYLKAEDHYLRICTNVGSELILMRLKDAIKELGGIDGLQVHRSYWVARNAVEHVARHRRKTELLLKNGSCVPVSESFLPAVKEADWPTK